MSETVKRWTEQVSFDGLSHRMTEFEHGEYVSYCDYVVLEQRCAALERERDEALLANELDRRNLHKIVREIEEEIRGRMWLIEGRGSYEWDDDTYKKEFGWAVNAIQAKLEPLRKIAGDLRDSPKTEIGVEAARKYERDLAAAEQRAEVAERALMILLPFLRAGAPAWDSDNLRYRTQTEIRDWALAEAGRQLAAEQPKEKP